MESRFTPFLSTNYVPSKQELNEIHDLLTDPVDQLFRLDAEIARLQSTIDELTLKRNHLRAHVIGHRNLTAPLRRVPEELLQEIFFRCLPVDHNAVMSCHEAPLLLGRVCSQWRSVLLSTPRLWSSIHIVISGDANEPWSSPGFLTTSSTSVNQNFTSEAVRAWLSRSGGLPLSISVYQETFVHTPKEEVDDLLSALMQFSPRWKDISLITTPPTSSQLSSLSHKTLPLLETFSLHDTANSPSPVHEFPPFDIFRAPRIRTVSIYNLGLAPKDMNWSQLTSLSLETRGRGAAMLTPSNILDIFGKSPNLIHCELDFTSGWGDFPSVDDEVVVTMPSLETLSIREGTQTLKPLFEQLRLPVLFSLEFSPSSSGQHLDPGNTGEQPICALLSRLDSLKTFTLSAPNSTHTILMDCLRHASSITQLSVLTPQLPRFWPFPIDVQSPFTDEVAALLTPTEGQLLVVCPLLRVLECNPCNISDAALLNMIQHRTVHATTHGAQPLERIDVILHRERDIEIMSMLPPNILAETTIALKYLSPKVLQRRITPKAGLEGLGKLCIPSRTHKCLYH